MALDMKKVFRAIEEGFDASHSFDIGKITYAAKHNGFKMKCGISKVCFISPNSGWVIKVDRNSSGDCQREYDNYKKAQRMRIEKAFLKTIFLGHGPYGIPMYAQKKINSVVADLEEDNVYVKRISNISLMTIRKIRDAFFESDITDYEWIGMMILLYGEEFAKKLAYFTVANQINDLHEYNRGFLNGKPVIMDYSGIGF